MFWDNVYAPYVSFSNTLPRDIVVESVIFSLYQSAVYGTPYAPGRSLRVEDCRPATCKEYTCKVGTASPLLCSTAALGTCKVEVKQFFGIGGIQLVVKLHPQENEIDPGSQMMFFASGPNAPALQVTYLGH